MKGGRVGTFWWISPSSQRGSSDWRSEFYTVWNALSNAISIIFQGWVWRKNYDDLLIQRLIQTTLPSEMLKISTSIEGAHSIERWKLSPMNIVKLGLAVEEGVEISRRFLSSSASYRLADMNESIWWASFDRGWKWNLRKGAHSIENWKLIPTNIVKLGLWVEEGVEISRRSLSSSASYTLADMNESIWRASLDRGWKWNLRKCAHSIENWKLIPMSIVKLGLSVKEGLENPRRFFGSWSSSMLAHFKLALKWARLDIDKNWSFKPGLHLIENSIEIQTVIGYQWNGVREGIEKLKIFQRLIYGKSWYQILLSWFQITINQISLAQGRLSIVNQL